MPVQPHPTQVVFTNKVNRINYVTGIKDDAQEILDNAHNYDGLDVGYANKIKVACDKLITALNHFAG